MKKSIETVNSLLEASSRRGGNNGYSLIKWEEIVVHVYTKEGSKRDALGEIMDQNKFKHTQTQDNLVVFEDDDKVVTMECNGYTNTWKVESN